MAMLAEWFIPIDDYARKDVSETYHENADDFRARRLDLEQIDWSLPHPPILVGHFELPGCALFERYPEAAAAPYRRIIFLREPLERAKSYFRYARKSGRFPLRNDRLAEFLASLENPMARLLAPEPEDAPAALAAYWFVGTLETARRDAVRLSRLLTKPPAALPHINRTSGVDDPLPDPVIAAFRSKNQIDYRLWHMARTHGLAGGPERMGEIG